MADTLKLFIDILGSNAGAVSAVASMKALDKSVEKASAGVKELETALEKAQAVEAASKGKGAKEQAKAAENVAKAQAKLAAGKDKQGAAAEKRALFDAKMEARQADNAVKQAAKREKDIAAAKAKAEKAAKAEGLAAKAKEAGGPIGNLVSKFEQLAKLGKVGIALAVVAALAAVAVSGLVAAAALSKYALTASDAARSSALLSEAATGGAAGGKELETVVDQLSGKFGALRGQTVAWARELSLAEIKGRDMQRTLTTMGIVASAVGDSAAGKIKGIAEASRMADKLMLGARDRFGEFASLQGTGIKAADIYAAVAKSMRTSIPEAQRMVKAGIVPFRKGLEALEAAAETRFGPIVARQMMSLDVQAAKLKENIARLFSGANIDKFLAGLKTITDLFDTNTVTGYILREVMSAAFTKIADVAALVFPYIKAAIEGVVIGVLIVASAAKKLYKQFQETFGGAGKNIDGLKLAFQAGAGIVGAFVGAIVGLTAAFAILGATAVVALAPIWIPIALGALMLYAMVKAADAVVDSVTSLSSDLSKIDLGKAAENIMNTLIKGIKSKIADVKSAMSEVGGALLGSFDTKMDIQSPSGEMLKRADFVIDPLVTQPQARAGEVQAAIGGLGSLDKPRALPSAGGTGGGLQTEKVELHFHGLKEDQVAPKVHEVLISLMQGDMRGFTLVTQ